MKTHATVLMLFLAAVTIATQPAFAQCDPTCWFLTYDMATSKAIHAALRLDNEQRGALMATSRKLQNKYQERVHDTKDSPDPEDKLTGIRLELKAELNGTLARVLESDQQTRFNQIRLQNRGVEALLEPAVRRTLGLKSAQIEKLESLAREAQAIQREKAVMYQRADDETTRKRLESEMTNERKKAMARALDELSGAQRSAWEKLTGEPFEFRRSRFVDGSEPRKSP